MSQNSKSAKYYDFEIDSHPEYPLSKDGFSSIRGTLKDAFNWANTLIIRNPSSNVVHFRAENGRKVYTVKRVPRWIVKVTFIKSVYTSLSAITYEISAPSKEVAKVKAMLQCQRDGNEMFVKSIKITPVKKGE